MFAAYRDLLLAGRALKFIGSVAMPASEMNGYPSFGAHHFLFTGHTDIHWILRVLAMRLSLTS
jgi:hypothetical protein